jgi:hypothetical protein
LRDRAEILFAAKERKMVHIPEYSPFFCDAGSEQQDQARS